jgi:hypothetical protein
MSLTENVNGVDVECSPEREAEFRRMWAASDAADIFTRIAAEAASRIGAGFPRDGRHVQIDDGSRANLTALALTADLALRGVVPWPDDYAKGWITIEGDRLPLNQPKDGLSLSYAAGLYYSAIVQHQRDLEGYAEAGQDVDPTKGWPS